MINVIILLLYCFIRWIKFDKLDFVGKNNTITNGLAQHD